MFVWTKIKMSLPQKDSKFYEHSNYAKIFDVREDLGIENREFGNKIWDRALVFVNSSHAKNVFICSEKNI